VRYEWGWWVARTGVLWGLENRCRGRHGGSSMLQWTILWRVRPGAYLMDRADGNRQLPTGRRSGCDFYLSRSRLWPSSVFNVGELIRQRVRQKSVHSINHYCIPYYMQITRNERKDSLSEIACQYRFAAWPGLPPIPSLISEEANGYWVS